MNPADDDCFREPGSRYEHEAPVAVAVVDATAVVDWSDAAHSPAGTLWLPETLFQQLAAATRLREVDLSKQTRLTSWECQGLAPELAELERATADPDVRKATVLVRARVESVASSTRTQAWRARRCSVKRRSLTGRLSGPA
jgi:hypothetical protein